MAERSESLGDFGRNLRDWLHELRGFRHVPKRRQRSRTPARLREKFPQGQVADAWLAAYAEHLAGNVDLPVLNWAFEPSRTSAEPIFDEAGGQPDVAIARAHALTTRFQASKYFHASGRFAVVTPDVRPNQPRRSEEQTLTANGDSGKPGSKSWRRCGS